MAEERIPTDIQTVTLKWMRIANGVARGHLGPEEGIAMLQALAEENPEDRDWLQDEIETIWHQFGLDVAEKIRNGQGSYWDKLRLVLNALLDERMDYNRTLDLLMLIDAQHPQHTEQTSKLINGIEDSPLRHFLETDD
jgi:hypothetical protein